MKREIIVGKDFCTYIKTPLIADDVHAYNIVWEAGEAAAGAGLLINAKRSDGVTVTDFGVMDEKGRGEYILAGNMYSVAGSLEIRLSVVCETTTLTEKLLIFEVMEGNGNESIESEDNVPLLTSVLSKTAEAVAKTANIPARLSDMENDCDFVSDANYVHTDNNFTDEYKETIDNHEEIIVTTRDELWELGAELEASQASIEANSGLISNLLDDIYNVEQIAKGANQGISFKNYEEMIKFFNENFDNPELEYPYSIGQNIYIETLEVPDLWISTSGPNVEFYDYESDEAFINALKTKGSVQVGWYTFSQLETQKVDLTGYVTKGEIDETLSTKVDKSYVANALKNKVNGEIVSISDISPIEHDLTVKVSSKNLISNTYKTVTTNGVTFTVEEDGSITANGTATKNIALVLIPTNNPISLVNGEKYTLSGSAKGSSYSTYYMALQTTDYVKAYNDVGAGITFTSNGKPLYFYISVQSGVVMEGVVFKPQLELGATATSYTPYVPDISTTTLKRYGVDETDNLEEYTPNADGTVEGVKSIYPNMTLKPDTQGVLVEVEYNRDLNKAFAELQQAIISLGGNV